MSIVLATFTVAFVAFYALSHRLVGGLGVARPGTTPRQWVLRRFAALGLYGGLPLVVSLLWLPEGLDGLGLGDPLRALGVVAVCGAIAGPVLWMATKQPNLQRQYPQIRRSEWTRGDVATSIVSWGAFLLGYEFLFRGFLLSATLEPMGLWPAIWLNVALYTVVHADKDPQEVAACIPMGLLFCGMTLWTGAFWAAFAVHCIIAWVSTVGAISANPEMALVHSRSAAASSAS